MSQNQSAASKGTLYLIPTSLGEASAFRVRDSRLDTILEALGYFIVENEKSARASLKELGFKRPISSVKFSLLNEHTPSKELETLIEPILKGEDAGLLSEAGCPCVADPGSNLVRLAHQRGVLVRPMVGPSSFLLALMASGLNGQSFVFHGYVPQEANARIKFLHQIERESSQHKQTQIFMDTPYRSRKLSEEVIRNCSPRTLLCIAASLMQDNESISTMSIQDWRKHGELPGKEPVVFLLQG